MIIPSRNHNERTAILGSALPVLFADAPYLLPSLCPLLHRPSLRVTLTPSEEAIVLPPHLLLKDHGGRAADQVAPQVLCVRRWVDDDGGAGDKWVETRRPLVTRACSLEVTDVPVRLQRAGVGH